MAHAWRACGSFDPRGFESHLLRPGPRSLKERAPASGAGDASSSLAGDTQFDGCVAQGLEHHPYKMGVAGSNPAASTESLVLSFKGKLFVLLFDLSFFQEARRRPKRW